MPMYQNWKEATTANQKKRCSVPGCEQYRAGVSSYCGRHHWHNIQYGHPLQSALRFDAYETERKDVRDVLIHNANHDGVKATLHFFRDWMEQAGTGRTAPASAHMAVLYDRGVSPMDCLVETGALWLLRERDGRIIKSDKALDRLMGWRLLRLAKTGKTISSTRQTVGSHIRNNAGVFFINLCRTIDQWDQGRYNVRMMQAAPLVPVH